MRHVGLNVYAPRTATAGFGVRPSRMQTAQTQARAQAQAQMQAAQAPLPEPPQRQSADATVLARVPTPALAQPHQAVEGPAQWQFVEHLMPLPAGDALGLPAAAAAIGSTRHSLAAAVPAPTSKPPPAELSGPLPVPRPDAAVDAGTWSGSASNGWDSTGLDASAGASPYGWTARPTKLVTAAGTRITRCEWSADGRWLAATTDGGPGADVFFMNGKTHGKGFTLPASGARVVDVCFGWEGPGNAHLLASASDAGTVHLWDLRSGQPQNVGVRAAAYGTVPHRAAHTAFSVYAGVCRAALTAADVLAAAAV